MQASIPTPPATDAVEKVISAFKKGKLNVDFSTSTDLFLNTKGKMLRNKQKKLDKINAVAKQIKQGEIVATDAQKEMVAGKETL